MLLAACNGGEARDGGVHGLFTVSGRPEADGCALRQPDFAAGLARNNVSFRIPTPVFGAGLIEAIADSEIRRNAAVAGAAKPAHGIRGRPNVLLAGQSITGTPNRDGNDGTIGRLGWKAQNESLPIFSGEAYNVEMGITNLAFPTEREETEGCGALAPPKPSLRVAGASAASIDAGRRHFADIGRALCHTPTPNTHPNAVPASMAGKAANVYSDLPLHDLGVRLADGIQQGQASGREWRSAPLWGLGQRLLFLHVGRTTVLRDAFAAYASSGSDANAVVQRFFALPAAQQQELLNFLRSSLAAATIDLV